MSSQNLNLYLTTEHECGYLPGYTAMNLVPDPCVPMSMDLYGQLIELGYNDAMKVRDELREFISGGDVPRLYAPSWIRKDLSAFHSD